MMDPIKKSQWCEALRSGRYKQGRMALEDKHGFCCLGVARAEGLAGSRRSQLTADGRKDELLSSRQCLSLGIEMSTQDNLARMNDEGDSFEAIARWIEANL